MPDKRCISVTGTTPSPRRNNSIISALASSSVLIARLRRAPASASAARISPVKVDRWGLAGQLRVWLLAEDGWWGLVAGRTGVRWMRAEDLRQSGPVQSHHL